MPKATTMESNLGNHKIKNRRKDFCAIDFGCLGGTTDEDKMERFKHHLEIAKRLNAVKEVETLIGSLDESDWHHKGE